jgi:hypothetical protein
MKKFFWFLVLSLLACTAGATNWLTNPGLLGSDVAPTSWYQIGGSNQTVSSTYRTATPSRRFSGASVIYQDIAYNRVAGNWIDFYAYLYNRPDDPLTGTRKGVVKVEFFDVAYSYLSNSVSANSISATSTLGTWVKIEGWAQVPAGTRYVRFKVVLANAEYGTGSFNADDCSLDWNTGETPDPTFTATNTTTPTVTPTNTPTRTCTPQTPTLTNTPVNTLTPTLTYTKTYTPTPTYTATPAAVNYGAINCVSLASTNFITAGNGVGVTSGDVTITAGDLILNSGNISTTGNVSATNGLVVSSGSTTITAGCLIMTAGYIQNPAGGWYISGTASTRDAARLGTYGQAAPVGSLYISTAGKMYLKTGNSNVTGDYQRVSTTAAD